MIRAASTFSNLFLALILTAVTSSMCVASDDGQMSHSTAALSETLSRLNLANPVDDLNKNWKNRDRRFIGIYGVACDTPGVPEEGRKYVRSPHYGRRCLDGTTDVVENDKHMAMIEEAIKYATSYNTELLRRIQRRDNKNDSPAK